MNKWLACFIISNLLFCTAEHLSAQTSVSEPDTVKVGAYVISLHDINFRDKEYSMRFWVWMLYTNPDFNFAKRVEVSNAKETEIQDVMIDSTDGKIWVLMKLKCTMKQNWRVLDYPFDKQSLVVHVENSEFDTRNMVFVPDTSGAHFDPQFTVDGWDITRLTTYTGTSQYYTRFGDASLDSDHSEYASFTIELDLERNAWGLFLKLFIGMYISFFIAFISFYLDHEDIDPRFGLPVGGLFASVGNKYIIDSILPETSSFTLVDTLHSLTFFNIFMILALSTYTRRMYKKGQIQKAKRIDKASRRIVATIYILLNVCMVVLAMIG